MFDFGERCSLRIKCDAKIMLSVARLTLFSHRALLGRVQRDVK